jgi:6-phosphogluconolactonase
MPSPHIVIAKNPETLTHDALRLVVDAATKAIAERGTFSIALSGGSTPKALYQLLAKGEPSKPAWPFDWNRFHVFFGDERCVPPDHPDSNYKMASEALLSHVPIPPTNVHRMKGEIDPNEAAKEYGQTLKHIFGDSGGVDVNLLGMGDDGHTASLFPGTPALDETHHRVVAQFVEHSTTGKSWRITMTPPFINRSREVFVIVVGKGKAKRLNEVLHGPRDSHRLPIQLIQPAGQMVWLLDEAAASELQ